MTVKEIFYSKYLEMLKTINSTTWNNMNLYAKERKLHLADYMLLCLKITEHDIRKHGGYNGDFYKELNDLHQKKILASNRHRQAHGQITKYWVTKKGLKKLSFNA